MLILPPGGMIWEMKLNFDTENKILESGAGASRPLRSAPWGSVVGNQIGIIEPSLNKNIAINLGIGVNEESLLLASQFYTTPAMLAINASLRTTFK